MFVVAMEIHKRLAEDSSVQYGGRSSYYLRTQKLFNVWMRKLIWFPSCPKKNLVTLELALFYLSQGNIDNAHIATRTLIANGKLQTEPILNLVHGLISFDKWYSGLPKDMQVEDFDVYDESCGIPMKSNGSAGTDLLVNSDEDSMNIDESSLATCSSESSINNENIDKKMNNKPGFLHPKEEMDPLESQGNENLRSIFLDTSDGPTCGTRTRDFGCYLSCVLLPSQVAGLFAMMQLHLCFLSE
ncbi:F12M16.11 [Zea mays]|nr:F12M16.11 [Zea mays]